ncbi:MAG TPA: hypothetical protein VNI83_10320 [Vicinamibacterales bacterium]|nr:hypothetical protein [Vicinamibacterales bacterium]
MQLRRGFRLTGGTGRLEWRVLSRTNHRVTQRIVTVHRFERIIAGREFLIEVRAVGDRWRAHLVRAAGGSTALMPFYGATPDEAARQLDAWLARAHRRDQDTPSS